MNKQKTIKTCVRGEEGKGFYCPEITFFQVDQEEKTVKIDGDLQYTETELELIEYIGSYLRYENLDQDTLYEELSNYKQYYRSVSDDEALSLITSFYCEPVKPLDLFSVDENTPNGCYMHVWGCLPWQDQNANNKVAARIWFASSQAEDDETEFDTGDPAEIIKLFMNFAEENGIMDSKLKICDIEYVALNDDRSQRLFIRNSEGDCPVCGAEGLLEYDSRIDLDHGVAYPWRCARCGATGEEHYTLVFATHENVCTADYATVVRGE
jgi:hypothetical protein